MTKKLILLLAAFLLLALPTGAEEKTLKIYNWSDYIDPQVIAAFEKETGVKVIYDTYDTSEVAETKLSAGHSGYDLVVLTTASVLARQIPLGIYQKLDYAKLQNSKYLWPEIKQRIAAYDPGNLHAIDYMWGTTGIGYNVQALQKRVGEANTWGIIFDPEQVSKFKDCGVYILDSSEDVFPSILNYLKLDPDTKSLDDLKKAADLLFSIRPYIKKFHSSEYINALANGDICLALGYSGDVLQAKSRAAEAAKNSGGKQVKIDYMIPQEGAEMWFDSFVIPADVGNPEAAYAFIDFVNRPEMAAKNSNLVSYANGNLESQKFLDKAILDNPNIYPSADVMKQLFTVTHYDQKTQSALNRMWTNIKANRKPY